MQQLTHGGAAMQQSTRLSKGKEEKFDFFSLRDGAATIAAGREVKQRLSER